MVDRWCPPHLRTAKWYRTQRERDAYLAEHPVYFLQYGAGGLIKIGHTRNIDKRMRDIQAMCPLPLRLLGWKLGGVEEETRLHHLFVDSLAWGEWYRPTADVLTYVATELQLSGRPRVPVDPHRSRAFRSEVEVYKAS